VLALRARTRGVLALRARTRGVLALRALTLCSHLTVL